MSRPEVSLCLIVRDESDLLPRFLEHARGLFDELVAEDTGSRDATPRGPSARVPSVPHLAAGDARAAESLARNLAADDPAAGLVAVLAALALGRDSAVELDLDPPEAEEALGEIASLLRAGARPEVLRALGTAAPAFSGTFPGSGPPWAGEAALDPR